MNDSCLNSVTHIQLAFFTVQLKCLFFPPPFFLMATQPFSCHILALKPFGWQPSPLAAQGTCGRQLTMQLMVWSPASESPVYIPPSALLWGPSTVLWKCFLLHLFTRGSRAPCSTSPVPFSTMTAVSRVALCQVTCSPSITYRNIGEINP